MIRLKKNHPIFTLVSSSLIDLPTPARIRRIWNLGSLLGLCLSIQLMTGVFLAMHYNRRVELAFSSVSHIVRDTNMGWLFRIAHANGARFFFICLYTHVLRGVYYGSFNFKLTWIRGVLIILILQATAFLGYVLPWGQMSFWGATVITNLVSSIPQIGNSIVIWLWGGFSVDQATLTRFFALHYLLPFILTALVVIHLIFLHQTGSNNPLGLTLNNDKIKFYPYFIEKDLLGFFLLITVYLSLILYAPLLLGDPENFLPSNSLVTPIHIQPEWYFLFAYAILRAIPNKLGGVIALGAAILIFLVLILNKKSKFRRLEFYPLRKFYYFLFLATIILLTFIGAKPVEEPYILIGQLLSLFYFSFFFFNNYLKLTWDNFIYSRNKNLYLIST